MKKYIFLIVFNILIINFSFADQNFSNYIWADKGWSLENIYANIYKYYENNINQSSYNAISKISSKLWIDTEYIKDVLNNNLTICSKFFDKLNINVKNWVYKENFQACYNQISSMYENYMQVDLWDKQLQDSLSIENLLTDGKEWNSPYDLLVDIEDIWKLLFKKQVHVEFWNIKIWNINNWWYNNNSKYNGLIPYDEMWTDKDNNTILQNKWTKSNSTTWYKQNIDKQNTYINNNLQIWNMCINNTIIETTNNGNSWSNTIIETTNNGNSWSNNDFNNIGFSTFIWDYINWWDFNLSWDNPVISWNNSITNTSNIVWLSYLCEWTDKILTVCVQFPHSWPNGPVWWTVQKNTLEWIIDQISNTLKDIRQSFVIAAWHGDESLDIDFKHVKLADIFAFNMILSKKPVFLFEKNEKAEEEKNKADTPLCNNVPRKLWSLYNETSIAYCNVKNTDQNKYLITNLDNISLKDRKPAKLIKTEEKVSSNSANGSYKEIDIYDQYNKNLFKFMENLEWLTRQWLNASITLKAKSE